MSERTFEVVLGVIGAGNAIIGLLALLAPDTFFEQIGNYGIENSHYVGDVGAFVTAYGFALLVAIRYPSWRVPVLALGAIWYGLHAINHAFDTGQARSEARGWADTAYIALIGMLLAYLARVAQGLPAPGGDRPR